MIDAFMEDAKAKIYELYLILNNYISVSSINNLIRLRPQSNFTRLKIQCFYSLLLNFVMEYKAKL